MVSVVVNDASTGVATETTIIDLGGGYFLTTTRDLGQVTAITGGTGTYTPPATLISSAPATSDATAKEELATKIAEQEFAPKEKYYSEAYKEPIYTPAPLSYREQAKEERKRELQEQLYDVHKTPTLTEDMPFTRRAGQNIVQIFPSSMLIEHEGKTRRLGDVYSIEDFQGSSYTAKISPFKTSPKGMILDLSGAIEMEAIEKQIAGSYQFQHPKITSGEPISYSDWSTQLVPTAQSVKMARWWSSLTPEQRLQEEVKQHIILIGMTGPLMFAGVGLLPTAVQLGLSYAGAGLISYEIISGATEKDYFGREKGLQYFVERGPLLAMDVALAYGSAKIGSAMLSQVGLTSALAKPQIVKQKSEVTGVHEIGDGLFRGSVKVKYQVKQGIFSKAKVVEKYDVLLTSEQFKIPQASFGHAPKNYPAFSGSFEKGAYLQTGRLDVTMLGGERYVTTKGLLGGWKTTTQPLTSRSEMVGLFGQTRGTFEVAGKKYLTEFGEFTSAEKMLYGKYVSVEGDVLTGSLSWSRQAVGRQLDVYTQGLGMGLKMDTSLAYPTPKAVPRYLKTPTETTYLGVGHLEPTISQSSMNQLLGVKPVGAIKLTPKDVSLIKSFGGQAQVQQVSTATRVKSVFGAVAGSLTQPKQIPSKTISLIQPSLTSFKDLFKPVATTGVKQIQVTTKQDTKQINLVAPASAQPLVFKQRERTGFIPVQIQEPAIAESHAEALASATAEMTLTKTTDKTTGLISTPVPPVPTPPVPFIFIPPLSLKFPKDERKKGTGFNVFGGYKPTLIAKEFKKFGKPTERITGFEVFRPMVKKKKKKTRRR